MTSDQLLPFLGWCTLINWGFLLFWWLMLMGMRDFVYRMHSKFFKVSETDFDRMHYQGIIYYKITVFIFNFVPYLVLRLVL